MEPLYQGVDGSGPEWRMWLHFLLKEGDGGELEGGDGLEEGSGGGGGHLFKPEW